MQDIENALRVELRDAEYSEGYAESFMNSFVATQIKVIREQRGMTQAELGKAIGTTQAGISRIEDVNYSSWGMKTLTKLARAFHVRLKVSFESFGTLPNEVVIFDRDNLERVAREEDPGLSESRPMLLEESSPGLIKAMSGKISGNLPVLIDSHRSHSLFRESTTDSGLNPSKMPSQNTKGGINAHLSCATR